MPLNRKWRLAALVALLLLVYGQTLTFDFINYDDDAYVTANPPVLKGLSADSVSWAFTNVSRFYWHPITWLSLMAEVELFGVSPGAMHATNVLLHLVATGVLYVALCRITGSAGRSFVVAALFAMHPLRVESVAWIAERKDVLYGLFTAITLLMYERWVRRPSRATYLALVVAMALACMAKPTAVILPVLMFLLDLWPFRRWAIREKIPLLLMSIAVSVLTYAGQRQMGALDFAPSVGLEHRLQNAIWSIAQYLRQTVWPAGFSIIYPYPQAFPGFAWVAAVLAGITGLTLWQRKQRPWLLMGWLWFLAGTGPTLGLIQAGVQGRADRFTYIAHIGLFLALVWAAAEFVPSRVAKPIAVASILTLAALSYQQAEQWRNSETIFGQALKNTRNNWLAEYKQASALLQRRATSEARVHFERAANLNPEDPHSRFHLGKLDAEQKRTSEAESWFAETVRLKPDYADAHFSRGVMLMSLNRPGEALEAFGRAINVGLQPEWQFQAYLASGVLLARSGEIREAARHFEAAAALRPDSQEARQNLAIAREHLRRTMGQ